MIHFWRIHAFQACLFNHSSTSPYNYQLEKKLSIKTESSKKLLSSGETGIRTPGASQHNGFQDRRNRPLCHLSENPSGFSRTIFCISSAERTRFELVVENNPYDSLANCWFQPLTHLSSGSLLRVQRYIRYFSLPNFLGCFFAVIFHNICKSLSVSGGCGTLWLWSFAMRQILSMFAYASRQSRSNQVWMLCARFALSYGEK